MSAESIPVTISATQTVRNIPLPTRTYLEEDNEKARVFLAREASIIYTREYNADTGATDGASTDWEVAVTVSGPRITAGVPGKQQGSRTYYGDERDEIPSWLGGYVDQYHPTKRS